MASHDVVGPAVVLRTKSGSSHYAYQGAQIDADAFTEESVEHATSLGLIAEVVAPAESEDPFKGTSVADLKAEIAKRNEGREDDKKIVPAEPGNRPEIVAALVADDAAGE